MTDFAVSALARKRAALAGRIEAGEVRLRELRANLAHVVSAARPPGRTPRMSENTQIALAV